MKTHTSVRIPVHLVPPDGPATTRTFTILLITEVDYSGHKPVVHLRMDTNTFETQLQEFYEQQVHWFHTPFDVYVGDRLITRAL